MLVYIMIALLYFAIGLGSAHLWIKLEGKLSLLFAVTLFLLWPIVLIAWLINWSHEKEFYDK